MILRQRVKATLGVAVLAGGLVGCEPGRAPVYSVPTPQQDRPSHYHPEETAPAPPPSPGEPASPPAPR